MRPSLPVLADDAPVDASEPPSGFVRRAARPGLSPGTARRARVLAATLFATDAGAPPEARLDWLEAELSDFFGHVSLRARVLFSACVFAVSVLAPLTIGRLPTLARLPLDARVDAIHRFETTPLSIALLGAKAILSIVYFEHADAAREIGWDQRCMGPPA